MGISGSHWPGLGFFPMKIVGGKQTHSRLANAGILFGGMSAVPGHWDLRVLFKDLAAGLLMYVFHLHGISGCGIGRRTGPAGVGASPRIQHLTDVLLLGMGAKFIPATATD